MIKLLKKLAGTVDVGYCTLHIAPYSKVSCKKIKQKDKWKISTPPKKKHERVFPFRTTQRTGSYKGCARRRDGWILETGQYVEEELSCNQYMKYSLFIINIDSELVNLDVN